MNSTSNLSQGGTKGFIQRNIEPPTMTLQERSAKMEHMTDEELVGLQIMPHGNKQLM